MSLNVLSTYYYFITVIIINCSKVLFHSMKLFSNILSLHALLLMQSCHLLTI